MNIYLTTKELYDKLTHLPVVVAAKCFCQQVFLQETPDSVSLCDQEGMRTSLVWPLPKLEILFINRDEWETFPSISQGDDMWDLQLEYSNI